MRSRRDGNSPVMIGRDGELRTLLELAASGQPHVAMIAGESGVGKSRLVRELLAGLDPLTVTLTGQAEPDSLARPYEVLFSATEGTADEIQREALTAVSDSTLSPVQRLRAAVELVADMVGDRPAVLIFEDLHWADSESAILFERLADTDSPRLLVGTYRPDEVTGRQPVAALLERMERRHSVTHVRLDPLDEVQTATLMAAVAGGPVPARAAASLYHRTGGNPFFVEELLRGLSVDDIVDLDSQPLPWSLAEVLRSQWDTLAPDARGVVEAAAVLGQRIEFDVLAQVSDTTEPELIRVLRELVDRGLLVETDDDEFTFRHALHREALTGQMLGRQRRRLHEKALDALLATGAPHPAQVAHHAAGAGRYAELVDAARRGAVLYLSIGSAYQALQLAEMGLDEAPDDVDLLAAAARAAWLAGLPDTAAGYAQRWDVAAASASERAEALYLRVRLAFETDQIAEMRVLTGRVADLADQLAPGADQARAMIALAQSALLLDDAAGALEWAERALDLAVAADLPDLRLAALVEKGLAMTDQVDTEAEGDEILAGVVDAAERRSEWVLAARALNALVQSIPPADPAEHAQMLERMRLNAERAGFDTLATAAYYQGRARLAMRAGDLDAALSALRQGREHDRPVQRRGRRADYHAVFLAGLCLEAGELDAVEQILGELRTIPAIDAVTIPGLAFHLACRRGNTGAARAALDDVFTAMTQQHWRSGAMTHDLVAAAMHIGLPVPLLERMADVLLDDSLYPAHLTLVGAQLAEARGDPGAALEGYRSVVDAAVLDPSVRGSAHTGAARCLLALRRPDDAAESVDAATRLLARWRGWRVDQLRLIRDQLGMTPVDGPTPVTGPGALTPREREVAVLVADGLTNGEVARRLYISPRTAAVHVSSILRKLCVDSRNDIGPVFSTPSATDS